MLVVSLFVIVSYAQANAGGDTRMLEPGHLLDVQEALRAVKTPPSSAPQAPVVAPARTAEAELLEARLKSLESAWLKNVDLAQKIAISFLELKDAFEALSKRDLEFDPNVRPAGFPGLPVSCGAASRGSGSEASGEDCQRCYRDAQASLHKAAFTLEKLRILHKRTKAVVDKAVSFGDTTSGIHAVSGLAWQTERTKIVKSIKKMDEAFDAKKPELMGRLKAALDEIGECEAKHFANPDWYNRFGFMYYETMNAKTIRAE